MGRLRLSLSAEQTVTCCTRGTAVQVRPTVARTAILNLGGFRRQRWAYERLDRGYAHLERYAVVPLVHELALARLTATRPVRHTPRYYRRTALRCIDPGRE